MNMFKKALEPNFCVDVTNARKRLPVDVIKANSSRLEKVRGLYIPGYGAENLAPLLHAFTVTLPVDAANVIEIGSGYTTPFIADALDAQGKLFSINDESQNSLVVSEILEASKSERVEVVKQKWTSELNVSELRNSQMNGQKNGAVVERCLQ